MIKDTLKQIKTYLHMPSYDNIYAYLVILLSFSIPLSWKFSKIVLMLIMLIFLLQGKYKKYLLEIKQIPLLLAICIFASYELLTFFWTSESFSNYSNYMRNYLLWFSIPIIALSVKAKYIRSIISAFLFAMVISEIVAYGMYFELWTVKGNGPEYPSPFMHHAIYGLFLAFSSIILLNRILSKDYSWTQKIFMSIFFITLSGNLFISLGRMGQIIYIISIVIMGIMHFKMTFKTLFSFSTLIVFILSLAYNFSPTFQTRIHEAEQDIERISKNDLYTSWGIRVAYIMLGTEIIKDNAIIGVGIGDARLSAKKYLNTEKFNFSEQLKDFLSVYHFHNLYLTVIVQSGIIGIVLFMIMFYLYFCLVVDDDEIRKLSVIFPLMYLIGSIAEPFFLVAQSNTIFILFSSIFIIASKEYYLKRNSN